MFHLTKSAVDAFGHVNIVPRRPPRAVFALLGFDGDCLKQFIVSL